MAEGLRRAAVKLALAGGVEYGLQAVVPAVLVRCLDMTAFGQYRLLWLLAATSLSLATCFIPQSLFYFLPRTETASQKSALLGNSVLFLGFTALLTAFFSSVWNPWLPHAAHQLFDATHGLSSVFLALWVLTSLADVLPTAEGRAHWQAKVTVTLAVGRTLLLVAAAVLTSSVVWVVLAVVATVCAKVGCMLYYLRDSLDGQSLRVDRLALRRQLVYALPFALATALFTMRTQVDQWVVATMLSPALYAMFSIATVFQPISSLLRQPVFNAAMPRMSAGFADGDLEQVRQLVARTNGATAFAVLPIAGGIFAVAPEVVHIVYTSTYSQTADVMRIYLLGMGINCFATGHMVQVISRGHFATINNALCLVLGAIISIAGVKLFGVTGAAIGSVVALAISEGWTAMVVARALDARVAQILAVRSLLPTIVALTCGVVAALLVDYWLSTTVWLALGVKGTIYALTWLAIMMACGEGHRLRAMVLKR